MTKPLTSQPIAQQLGNELLNRSNAGIAKYGVSLDDAPLTPAQVIQHAIEEALDLASYLKKLANEKPNYERETLLGTLFAWSSGQGNVMPVERKKFGYRFEVRAQDFVAELDLSVDELPWHFMYADSRGNFTHGDIHTPADLLTLLSRLLPADDICEGRG